MRYFLMMIVVVMGCGKKTPQPPPESIPTPKGELKEPEPPKDPIESAIRKELKKPNGELTKEDLEKVRWLGLGNCEITDLSPLAGLTSLTALGLHRNQITDLTPLKGLTELKLLDLHHNPNLTKAEIEKLQEALPKCKISHGFEGIIPPRENP